MILRLIYFLVIGWWLGLFAAGIAYLLCLTIIGIPFGLIILNRIPTLIFMKEPGEACEYGYDHRHAMEELPFLLRVIWFFLLGWELGMLALVLGYLLCVTIVFIPFGIFILNRVPLLMTLSRHYG